MSAKIGMATKLVGACCCVALLTSTANAAPDNARSYNILPLLSVRKTYSSRASLTKPLSGYVRFWIEKVDRCGAATETDRQSADEVDFQPIGPGERQYSQEKRDWLSRLFWGRSYARILQAKLTVTRSHVVTDTVTLASAAHMSSGHEGENWSSQIGDRQFLTPFFRVDQGTTAQVDVTLSATKEAESSVTKNVLSIVEAGAKLVAPTGPLVTALNSDRLTQTSNFIDTSISRLFHEKIEEKSSSDFPADAWLSPATNADTACGHAYRRIATIAARFPMGKKVWTSTGYEPIGAWAIYVTDPIVSIFSDVPLNAASSKDVSGRAASRVSQSQTSDGCSNGGGVVETGQPKSLTGIDRQACLAFRGLAPTRVLSLIVDDKVTLGDALRANAGISAAVQRYAGLSNDATKSANEAKKGKADAQRIGREICNLIAERAEAIGLNQWDSAAAVWAFAWNGGLDETLAESIWESGCLTANLGHKINLSKVISVTSDSPDPAPATP
jgi:hypothetical protein